MPAPAFSGPNQCLVCEILDISDDPNHRSSNLHIFNFHIWQYNNYRKQLVKDRNGIRVTIEPNIVNNLAINHDFLRSRGKLTIKVTPEQLNLHENNIEFGSKVINDRRDEIFLTSVKILDANQLFHWYDTSNQFREDVDAVLMIKSKDTYGNLVFKFHIHGIVVSNFRFPIAFNFQTKDDETFTICRTVVIKISNDEIVVQQTESPFTSVQWRNVTIIPPTKKSHYINNYPIPNQYHASIKFGLTDYHGISSRDYAFTQEIKYHLRDGIVTTSNYQMFFHILLWLDEMAEVLMLSHYNMENVTMKINSDLLELVVPGLAEKRPSLVVGDLIRIRIHEDHIAYEGYIKMVTDKTIIIQHVNKQFRDYIENNPKMELDVAFALGRLPLERAHRGIDSVVTSGMVQALFPDWSFVRRHVTNTIHLEDSEFRNLDILENIEQKTAVEKILNCSSQRAPYIVFGPPGTGKTVTIVEAIYQILKKTKKRILVCAPANAACDMLTNRLMAFCRTDELVRVHSDSRERSSITDKLKEYSNITDDGDFLKITAKNLMKYRIVVTTLILSGRYNDAQGSYRPDVVFIDEAAQAKEPEACIAIGLMKLGGQLVLAGDQKQLGPITMSKVAEKYNLGKSLLERLMDTIEIYRSNDSNFTTMLRMNFRSHENILQVPNELFYENRLMAISVIPLQDPLSKTALYPKIQGLNNKFRGKKHLGQAIEFCSVSSRERREGRSPSYFNPVEIEMVCSYIRTLMGLNFAENHKVLPSDIGVITPYIRQVYRIKDKLASYGYGEVEVGTTETFQGREKRIILISTVRAQNNLLLHDRKYNLGFVRNEKRFNVAITRAISKLVIIGCPAVLGTDSNWIRLIEQCEQLRSYFGAPYERRTEEKISQITHRLSTVRKERT